MGFAGGILWGAMAFAIRGDWIAGTILTLAFLPTV
jgi:hypothetical protein